MRAWLNLRYSSGDRVEAFAAGLKRVGYRVEFGMPSKTIPGDLFVTWNRIGQGDRWAREFASAGNSVIVAENSSWGNESFHGGWLTLARDFHNTAGMFPVGGPERWDALGAELDPWRTEGETVVLPQRGFGPPEVAMPPGWVARQSGRVRRHPGMAKATPLVVDLANAGRVVTWGSAAAVQALLWGIPVRSDMPGWIGAQDNTDAGRIDMLRRMAWAQWKLDEIRQGEPFAWLLKSQS